MAEKKIEDLSFEEALKGQESFFDESEKAKIK